MIKVKYEYCQSNGAGGGGKWFESIKLYNDDIPAENLQEEIDKFLKDDVCGYRKNIKVVDIVRI